MHRVFGEGAIMGIFLSDSFLLRQGSPATKQAKLDRSVKGSATLIDLFDSSGNP